MGGKQQRLIEPGERGTWHEETPCALRDESWPSPVHGMGAAMEKAGREEERQDAPAEEGLKQMNPVQRAGIEAAREGHVDEEHADDREPLDGVYRGESVGRVQRQSRVGRTG